MANEEMVIDVTVNGKKAQVELNKVEKATDDVGKQTKKTASMMSASWVKIGSRIGVVVAGMALLTREGMKLEKATFGLSKAMKDFAMQTAITSGLTTEVVAGFIQTGKSAGMAEGQIKNMVDMAIALGRKYPHESAETFIDNLTQLNRTGEAQGYIVDILEQKYGLMDLKTLSLSEKMKALREVSEGVNDQFEVMASSKIDQIIGAVGVAIDKVGDFFLKLVDKIGVLDTIITKFKEWGLITEKHIEQSEDFTIVVEEQLTLWDKLAIGMINYANKHKTAMEQSKIATKELEDVGTRAMSTMEDSMVEMAMKGKTSFKDMANAIIADLIRIQIRQAVMRPLAGFLGLSFHTGTDEVKHTGGFIGNLPSHHSGSTRQDERIAKLQVGEAVINRAGASRNKEAIKAMNAGQPINGGTVQQTTAEINFNVQAIDSASFNNYLVGNRTTIESIINKSLATNGSVRQTIKQVV